MTDPGGGRDAGTASAPAVLGTSLIGRRREEVVKPVRDIPVRYMNYADWRMAVLRATLSALWPPSAAMPSARVTDEDALPAVREWFTETGYEDETALLGF